MTGPEPGPRTSGGRRHWRPALVVAVVATLVSVALATGLLGGPAAPSPEPRTSSAQTGPTAEGAPGTVAAPAMARSVPLRLRVPAIGVDSALMDLGLEDDGSLETPPGAFPAGWFTGAPTPGEIGPAIIVGHVRYETPGVFADLTNLRPDDRVLVEREDGSTARFAVTRVARFAKSDFPTAQVYGNIDHAGLRLITCGGLDATTDEYEENVVVFAELRPGRST